MYKVDLTEEEIRGVGVNRYIKTVGRWKLVTFIVGFFAVLVGALYWDYALGKTWMILAGAAWVAYTLYQARKEGKAGLKFLEDIKNGKNGN